jgi:hypothetical protein
VVAPVAKTSGAVAVIVTTWVAKAPLEVLQNETTAPSVRPLEISGRLNTTPEVDWTGMTTMFCCGVN